MPESKGMKKRLVCMKATHVRRSVRIIAQTMYNIFYRYMGHCLAFAFWQGPLSLSVHFITERRVNEKTVEEQSEREITAFSLSLSPSNLSFSPTHSLSLSLSLPLSLSLSPSPSLFLSHPLFLFLTLTHSLFLPLTHSFFLSPPERR